MIKQYPVLSNLINGCLHQDYDLIGDSLDEIIAYFIDCCTKDELLRLRLDISEFRADNSASIDAAFDEKYVDFDPRLWGSSADDFLSRVDNAVNDCL